MVGVYSPTLSPWLAWASFGIGWLQSNLNQLTQLPLVDISNINTSHSKVIVITIGYVKSSFISLKTV